jgi:hypothetical protein
MFTRAGAVGNEHSRSPLVKKCASLSRVAEDVAVATVLLFDAAAGDAASEPLPETTGFAAARSEEPVAVCATFLSNDPEIPILPGAGSRLAWE